MVDAPSAPASGPGPDPTPRTIEALYREIAALKEIVSAEIRSTKETIATRNDGYDKAIKLLQEKSDSMPSPALVQADVKALTLVVDERFKSISLQFQERDVRTEQTSRDSKVAVDAALQAAKEAVGEQNRSSALAISKSEAATSKQIDQQAALISTATGALNDKIDDLKGRLIRMEEGRTVTAVTTSAQKTDQQVSHVNTMGYVAIAISVGLAFFSLYGKPAPQVVERVQVEQPGE